MTHLKIYLAFLFTLLSVFLYSCSSITDSAQQNDLHSEALTADSNAKKEKVDVCHYDAELDAYKLINVAQPAVSAHEKHGDGKPGGFVPITEEGFVFDETCTPVEVEPDEPEPVEITACFAGARLNLLNFNPGVLAEDLNFETYTNWDKINDGVGTPLYGRSLNLLVRTFGTDEIYCTIEYPDPNSNLSYISNSDPFPLSDFDENKEYLEYLLSLNPNN